jgi:hypothetical protein
MPCSKTWPYHPKGESMKHPTTAAATRNRLLAHVRVDEKTGCWNWTAHRNNKGYGVLRFRNERAYAHRVSLIVFRRVRLGRKWALHRCDNPSCINPSHLYRGTCTENARDSVSRGLNPQTRKTHCPLGHPYDKANTRWSHRRAVDGGRRFFRSCATCKRQYWERRRTATA